MMKPLVSCQTEILAEDTILFNSAHTDALPSSSAFLWPLYPADVITILHSSCRRLMRRTAVRKLAFLLSLPEVLSFIEPMQRLIKRNRIREKSLKRNRSSAMFFLEKEGKTFQAEATLSVTLRPKNG
jgi:hypothetical protein